MVGPEKHDGLSFPQLYGVSLVGEGQLPCWNKRVVSYDVNFVDVEALDIELGGGIGLDVRNGHPF